MLGPELGWLVECIEHPRDLAMIHLLAYSVLVKTSAKEGLEECAWACGPNVMVNSIRSSATEVLTATSRGYSGYRGPYRGPPRSELMWLIFVHASQYTLESQGRSPVFIIVHSTQHAIISRIQGTAVSLELSTPQKKGGTRQQGGSTE